MLPREKAIGHIKNSIRKSYEHKGQAVVDKNFAAVDGTLARLGEAKVPATGTSQRELHALVPADAPAFRPRGHRPHFEGLGDELPAV